MSIPAPDNNPIHYSHSFYQEMHDEVAPAADGILPLVLRRIGPISSAVDVGCGVGTWSAGLLKLGVADLLAIDGFWVDLKMLQIPESHFVRMDLANLPKPDLANPKRYDLALSLEVAEHLPPEHADNFVDFLASLSDRILFSAAIPHQGGTNHLNEQWQEYWVNQFRNRGYMLYDFIRPMIWDHQQIPFWYKQNIMYFSKSPLDAALATGTSMPINVVHPELHLISSRKAFGILQCVNLLCRSIAATGINLFNRMARNS